MTRFNRDEGLKVWGMKKETNLQETESENVSRCSLVCSYSLPLPHSLIDFSLRKPNIQYLTSSVQILSLLCFTAMFESMKNLTHQSFPLTKNVFKSRNVSMLCVKSSIESKIETRGKRIKGCSRITVWYSDRWKFCWWWGNKWWKMNVDVSTSFTGIYDGFWKEETRFHLCEHFSLSREEWSTMVKGNNHKCLWKRIGKG